MMLNRYVARTTTPFVHRGQRKRAAVVDTHTGKVVDRYLTLGAAERCAEQSNQHEFRLALAGRS